MTNSSDTGETNYRVLRQDLFAVAIWSCVSIILTLLAFGISFLDSYPAVPSAGHVLARWERFDFIHFSDIARLGYFPAPGTASTPAPLYAFFPLLPYLLRAGSYLGLPLVVVGLSISWIAGALASAWIARIADVYKPGLGLRATAVFVVAPPSVFLFAPYTESLFLCFALGAWYFGLRQRWLLANSLTAIACTARISGAFLLVALIVLWITQRRERNEELNRRHILYFLLPISVLAAWMGALWYRTGDPLAYQSAQKYWGRHFEWPWISAGSTLQTYPPTGGPSVMAYLEVTAVLVGVIVVIVLVNKRLAGEAIFVAINVGLLATSTFFYSVPRSALLWWPLWIGVAGLLSRSKAFYSSYLLLSTASMLAWAGLYFRGQWSG